ncbi:stage IV sporulation protein FB [Anoxybacillus flavithermus]|uniref:site-2 protease family protein n=1 Tax=Anoxybacillus flavithermus TaxID=33934 RepID=UPI0018690FF2|nr:site-2 protease family protein [Anoxybacillus flavithermus]MBE2920654.1 stage IV sporulation protein FB [Anoxybacillus flavithermus]MBE2923229.1 stage IV sporulation protein FB [Anoxybacillus flavithermus]
MNKWLSTFMNIHIHPMLWFIALIAIMTAQFQTLLLLFWIVLWHELGHVFAAHLFSWRVKRVLLLPFGGVAEMDEHGNRPFYEELIVTIAGPLQHLIIFFIAYIAHHANVISSEMYRQLLEYNLSILLINLLPIWPLDGGKLLFLYRTMRTSFRRAHEQALYASIFFLSVCFICLLTMAPMQINLWIIVCFLAHAVWLEWKQRTYVWIRFLLERYYGKRIEYRALKRLVVDANDPLFRVLLLFHRGKKHAIIVKKNQMEMELDENELLYAYFHEKRTNEPIGHLLYTY